MRMQRLALEFPGILHAGEELSSLGFRVLAACPKV